MPPPPGSRSNDSADLLVGERPELLVVGRRDALDGELASGWSTVTASTVMFAVFSASRSCSDAVSVSSCSASSVLTLQDEVHAALEVEAELDLRATAA